MPIVLDPDPASTYGASREYRAAWLAAYGNVDPTDPTPYPPVDPPPASLSFVMADAAGDVLEHGTKLRQRYASIDSLGRVLQNGTPLEVSGGGGGTGDINYMHTQASPAATWVIVHNLGTRPDLLLFLDSDPDEPVYTDVAYPDENTAVVEWPTAETGIAYIKE